MRENACKTGTKKPFLSQKRLKNGQGNKLKGRDGADGFFFYFSSKCCNSGIRKSPARIALTVGRKPAPYKIGQKGHSTRRYRASDHSCQTGANFGVFFHARR